MKTAVLPSIQVEPHLLEALDAVLAEGETVAAFVEVASGLASSGVESRQSSSRPSSAPGMKHDVRASMSTPLS